MTENARGEGESGTRERRTPDHPEYVGDAIDHPGGGNEGPVGNDHAVGILSVGRVDTPRKLW